MISPNYYWKIVPRTSNPIITSITPNTGLVAGGQAITDLHGSGFVNGCTVKIGGVAATAVTFVSSSKLTCTTPAGTAGAKNVLVTNPNGQNSGDSGNGLYTYTVPPAFDPTLLSVDGWWEAAPYTALPIAGTPSAGLSGALDRSMITSGFGGTDPTVGPAYNGLNSAAFSTLGGGLGWQRMQNGKAPTFYTTNTDFTMFAVVDLTSLPAAAGQPYNDPYVFGATFYFGLTVHSDGAGGGIATFYLIDSTITQRKIQVAIPALGTPVMLVGRLTGQVMSLFVNAVKTDLSIAPNDMFTPSDNLTCGQANGLTHGMDGNGFIWVISKSAWSDTIINNWRTLYINPKWGTAL